MRSFIPILMLVNCSQAVTGSEAEDALVMRSHDEIALCVAEYTRLTGEPIADANGRY